MRFSDWSSYVCSSDLIRRVLLGKGILAGFRLRRYVGAHPGVRVVAALDYYNLRAARLKRRFGDQVHVMLTQRENLSADAAWRKAIKYRRTTQAVRRYFNDDDAVVTVSNGLDRKSTRLNSRP